MGHWLWPIWPTWPIQKWWPIWPMTHDPLTHFHLWLSSRLHITDRHAKVVRRSGKDIWICRPTHECCEMQDYGRWLLERFDCSGGQGCRNRSGRGFLLPGSHIEQWKLWQRVQHKIRESIECLRPADEYLEEQGYKSDDKSQTIWIARFVNVTV